MNFLSSTARCLSAWAFAALACLAAPAHAGPEAQVLISITLNNPRMANFDRVVLTQKPTGSQTAGAAYELVPLVRGVSTDTLVYGRSLPAGEYDVTALRQTIMGVVLPINQATRQMLGPIVVADGQSIDLGRLIVTSVNGRMRVGRSRLVESNQALLQPYEPGRWADFLAASKGQAPVRGWVDAPHDDDDVEPYALGRPTGFLRPTEGADGRVVAASRMGSVLVRSRAGSWTVLRSGRVESLAHAVPVDLPDTALVGVGELGLIVRQPVGSPDLQVVDPGDLPRGNLRFIAGGPATGWVVALQEGYKLRLMTSKQLAAGRWTPLREFDIKPLVRERPSLVWLWLTPEGLACAVPRGPIALLDLATGRWTEHRTPQGYPLLELAVGPKGLLTGLTVSAAGLAGEHALQFRSLDQGATWERLPAVPAKVKTLPEPPIALADGTLVIEGGDFKNPVLHASTDGGTTWQLRQLLRGDNRLYPLASGLLIAHMDAGTLTVDVSKDGGQSWKMEHSTFDLAAFKAEQAQNKAP